MILNLLPNCDVDVYFNDDGQIEAECLLNGDSDVVNISDLVNDLIKDFTPEDGPQPPLTRAQVQALYATAGALSKGANTINDFVRKHTPR
jgi:hypothetical protein